MIDGFVEKAVGVLSLIDGTVLPNCRLIANQPDGAIIAHDDIITKVMYSDLDPASVAKLK